MEELNNESLEIKNEGTTEDVKIWDLPAEPEEKNRGHFLRNFVIATASGVVALVLYKRHQKKKEEQKNLQESAENKSEEKSEKVVDGEVVSEEKVEEKESKKKN